MLYGDGWNTVLSIHDGQIEELGTKHWPTILCGKCRIKRWVRRTISCLIQKTTDHIAVVTTLANKGIGMTRQELVKSSGLTDNGAFSTVLEELEQCGFIRLYEPFSTSTRMSGDSRQKRNTLFQLIDFYTLFYFKFIKHNKYQDSHFWSSSQNTPMHHTWIGLSFEMLLPKPYREHQTVPRHIGCSNDSMFLA